MFPGERFPAGPYPTDRLRYKSKMIDGVALLVEQSSPDLLMLSVRLPAKLGETVSTIVHQIECDAQRPPHRAKSAMPR